MALSEGLQNALAACVGVPMELRTDRLTVGRQPQPQWQLRPRHPPATRSSALITVSEPAAAEYGELLAEVFSSLNGARRRRYEQDL